ncbi:ATP synthase F0 subunit C [Candidatus Peregrinibacteria bacterium]|nr:ATP synthase F0 subunit C [Candidatus Peregrinibacteria bacterium]
MNTTYVLNLFLPLAIAIPSIAIGWIGSKAMEAISRQPEATSKIQLNMILAIVFAEGLGILSFVLSLIMINK